MNINASDVVDGKPAIVLGLIWTIILYFQVSTVLKSWPFALSVVNGFAVSLCEFMRPALFEMRECCWLYTLWLSHDVSDFFTVLLVFDCMVEVEWGVRGGQSLWTLSLEAQKNAQFVNRNMMQTAKWFARGVTLYWPTTNTAMHFSCRHSR